MRSYDTYEHSESKKENKTEKTTTAAATVEPTDNEKLSQYVLLILWKNMRHSVFPNVQVYISERNGL